MPMLTRGGATCGTFPVVAPRAGNPLTEESPTAGSPEPDSALSDKQDGRSCKSAPAATSDSEDLCSLTFIRLHTPLRTGQPRGPLQTPGNLQSKEPAR